MNAARACRTRGIVFDHISTGRIHGLGQEAHHLCRCRRGRRRGRSRGRCHQGGRRRDQPARGDRRTRRIRLAVLGGRPQGHMVQMPLGVPVACVASTAPRTPPSTRRRSSGRPCWSIGRRSSPSSRRWTRGRLVLSRDFTFRLPGIAADPTLVGHVLFGHLSQWAMRSDSALLDRISLNTGDHT